MLTMGLMPLQISEEFNVAVLVTNQVMSDPSGGAMFVVDPKKPLGGHVMAHASTIRLSLRKGKGEQRVMKVVDSPNLRKSACALSTLLFIHCIVILSWKRDSCEGLPDALWPWHGVA